MLDDPSVPGHYAEALSGVSNLLDDLADQAWDNHGIDSLLQQPVAKILTYIQRKQMPLEVVDDVSAAVVNVTLGTAIERQLEVLLSILGLAELRRRIDAAAAARANPTSAAEPRQ